MTSVPPISAAAVLLECSEHALKHSASKTVEAFLMAVKGSDALCAWKALKPLVIENRQWVK
jgi:hypothetical protein